LPYPPQDGERFPTCGENLQQKNLCGLTEKIANQPTEFSTAGEIAQGSGETTCAFQKE
jgi:hypothetical protein